MPQIRGPVTRTETRRRPRTNHGATIDPRQPWVSSLARSGTRATTGPTAAPSVRTAAPARAQTSTVGEAGPAADRPVGEPDSSASAGITGESGPGHLEPDLTPTDQIQGDEPEAGHTETDDAGDAPLPASEGGAVLTPTFLDGSERVRLSWQHPESAAPPILDDGLPRILVASVTGVRVFDDRRRVTVHVREVDHPGDGELLLVGDLAGDPAATTVFESGDHHVPESAARVLDRSTVVVESRSAGIGRTVVQRNTVLWTACRDADAAAALVGDDDLVHRLADLACDHGDPVVRRSFEQALDVVPVPDVDGSDIRSGDVVRRPPGSGRTLRIRERATAPALRGNRYISGR